VTGTHIVLVDLWTDANRGDEALQAGLVRLLRRQHRGCRITGVFRFGTNEVADAAPEIAHTAAQLDEVLGGLRRTYYAAPNTGRFRGVLHQLVSTWSFVEALWCVAAHRMLGTRSRRVVGEERFQTLRALASADLVLWKGKNFRDQHGAAAVTRALTLGGAGWFAGLLRDRIDCVNASFWPVRHPVARLVYRRAFRRCGVLTVRDLPSVANARELLGPDVEVRWCPDLSLAVVDGTRPNPPAAGPWDQRRTVALTVTTWGDRAEHERYVGALTAACTRLAELGADRFVVVPQVTRAAEDNAATVAALVERAAGAGVHVEVLAGAPGIPELLDTYAGCRMLVGTRMHSCVFARSVGVPFVALAYDSGPKWQVLEPFWPRDLVLPSTTDAPSLVAAAERVWRDGGRLVAEGAAAWDDGVRRVEENVSWTGGRGG
jgi:colanic acid/amylovoran biosynthesis protein